MNSQAAQQAVWVLVIAVACIHVYVPSWPCACRLPEDPMCGTAKKETTQQLEPSLISDAQGQDRRRRLSCP